MLERNLKAVANRAMMQARFDPNARIMVLCGKAVNRASIWKYLIRNKESGFTYHTQSHRVEHKDGGVLDFRHCEQDMGRAYGGVQISHLWVDEYVKTADKLWLASRIRSAKEHIDPMGVYDYYGYMSVEWLLKTK